MALVFVGLGNPGSAYRNTRHNQGFDVIDKLAIALNVSLKQSDHAQIGQAHVNGKCLWLVKPLLFMNNSGRALTKFCRSKNLQPDSCYVFHDELGLAVGRVRVKLGGGNNGHNGLRDIDQHLGKNYYRVRLGIAHPGMTDQVHQYVLARPPMEEQTLLNTMVDAVVSNAILLTQENALQQFANALSTYHGDLKQH